MASDNSELPLKVDLVIWYRHSQTGVTLAKDGTSALQYIQKTIPHLQDLQICFYVMQTFVEGREAVDVEKSLGNTLFYIFIPFPIGSHWFPKHELMYL